MESIDELRMQLELYLGDLDSTQLRMVELIGQQQLCLVSPEPRAIVEFNNRGEQILETFQNLVERRSALLSEAQKRGFLVQNLEELGRLLGLDGSRQNLFQKLKTRGGLLVQSGFSQWVACQKANLHYRQLIQIIANGGKQSLQNTSNKGRSQGGAILDASV